jgi:HD-GYP domain-containing protein (c-di-GMP phosphodiesterase class II)
LSLSDRVPGGTNAFEQHGDYALDKRRKDLLWLVFALLGMLTLAFVLLVAYGHYSFGSDYTESMLLIGLLALLTCAVAYFADKEREHRRENRNLIHELHNTARALDARVARLNKLCETSTSLAGTLDVRRISELVVEALVAQVEADGASLVLVDTSKGRTLHRHSRGVLAELEAEHESPEEIARDAAQKGVPAMRLVQPSNDVARHLQAWSKTLASIAAPMKVSDLVGGALAAMRQDDFSSEDMNLLTTLANMAAKAIESAELHEQLRQSYFRTLHVLARSLAARDPYSAAHGEAVTWLASRLAERLGLRAEMAEVIRAYGQLHDLGKIGIADSVLLKEGPLSEEEVQVCRQHALIGEDIIRPLNPGSAVLSMIRNHHERWDGSGYPDGLKGEEIPLLARIVAVADAFHAMTSHRPYRPAALMYSAIQEIKSLSGSQFDPKVVEALLELWDEGEIVRFNLRQARNGESASIINGALSVSAPPVLVE